MGAGGMSSGPAAVGLAIVTAINRQLRRGTTSRAAKMPQYHHPATDC